eukprot:gene51890-53008_t
MGPSRRPRRDAALCALPSEQNGVALHGVRWGPYAAEEVREQRVPA